MAYASWSVVFGEQPSAAKWNILGTNDDSFNDGTGIAVSAITPEKLLTGTGTTWTMTSYTPTYANLTVGNGTHRSAYLQIGKIVFFRIGFTFGTTSTMGTAPTATLPVTAKSGIYTASGSLLASGGGTGGGTYSIPAYFATTTTLLFSIENSTATYSSLNNITSTNPFTWGTGYTLDSQGWYEAA